MTTNPRTQAPAPDALTDDFVFAGEWVVEVDGERALLFKDNGHTAESAKTAVTTLHSATRAAAARGAAITVRAMSVAELQATCDHMFLLADGECWRCGKASA